MISAPPSASGGWRPHRRPHVLGRHARRLRRKERPRKRRTKGKKSKNAKMAVVGVLYTLAAHEDSGLIGKRLYATFESHEALSIRLRHEADKRATVASRQCSSPMATTPSGGCRSGTSRRLRSVSIGGTWSRSCGPLAKRLHAEGSHWS